MAGVVRLFAKPSCMGANRLKFTLERAERYILVAL